MASISSRNLVDAVLRVERMSFTKRERLADEVHERQPNLFYSVLVLQLYGATLVQIEVVLNLLLVFHETMKISVEVNRADTRRRTSELAQAIGEVQTQGLARDALYEQGAAGGFRGALFGRRLRRGSGPERSAHCSRCSRWLTWS